MLKVGDIIIIPPDKGWDDPWVGTKHEVIRVDNTIQVFITKNLIEFKSRSGALIPVGWIANYPMMYYREGIITVYKTTRREYLLKWW